MLFKLKYILSAFHIAHKYAYILCLFSQASICSPTKYHLISSRNDCWIDNTRCCREILYKYSKIHKNTNAKTQYVRIPGALYPLFQHSQLIGFSFWLNIYLNFFISTQWHRENFTAYTWRGADNATNRAGVSYFTSYIRSHTRFVRSIMYTNSLFPKSYTVYTWQS